MGSIFQNGTYIHNSSWKNGCTSLLSSSYHIACSLPFIRRCHSSHLCWRGKRLLYLSLEGAPSREEQSGSSPAGRNSAQFWCSNVSAWAFRGNTRMQELCLLYFSLGLCIFCFAPRQQPLLQLCWESVQHQLRATRAANTRGFFRALLSS